MADIEKLILWKALSTGELPKLASRGLEVEHFVDENVQNIYEWALDFSKQYGQPPSISAVKEEFPRFKAKLSSDPLDSHIKKFVRKVKERKAIELVRAYHEILEDPDEIDNIEMHALEMARELTEVVPAPRSGRLSDGLARKYEYDRRKKEGIRHGVMMGVPSFDEITLGTQPHELVVIGGYLGRGKTTLMQLFALNAYLQGKVVLFISLEVEEEMILRKFDVMLSNVRYRALKALELDAGEEEAWTKILERCEADKMERDIIVRDNIPNCVSGETLVQTKNGLFTAKDLVGKTVNVLAGDKKYHPAEWRNYGKQKLYEVELETGDKLYSTLEHRWIVRAKTGTKTNPDMTTGKFNKEEVTTEDLLGRRIPVVTPDNFDYKSNNEWKEGVKNGLVYGDGSIYKQTSGSLPKSQLTQFGDSCELVERYFDNWGERKYSGLPRSVGVCALSADYKYLPNHLYFSGTYLRGFIAGLIASDGSCSDTGGVQVFSSKLEDLNYIREIAASCGMPTLPPRIMREISPFSGAYAPLWRLSFFKESFFIGNKIDEKLVLKSNHRLKMKNSGVSAKRIKTYKVVSVKETDRYEEVFCCTEPITNSWTTGYGILTGNCSTDKIAAEVIREKPGYLCVDYLEEMRAARGIIGWEAISQNGRDLKQHARVTKVPTVTATQLNRDGGKGEVDLSTLSYQSIGKQADILIGLGQTEDQSESQEMELFLLKYRDGPSKKSVIMDWKMERMIFQEKGAPQSFPLRASKKHLTKSEREAEKKLVRAVRSDKQNPFSKRSKSKSKSLASIRESKGAV